MVHLKIYELVWQNHNLPKVLFPDPNMAEWSGQAETTTGDCEEDRIAFWNSGLSVCIKCGKKNLASQEIRAGVRANGEAYGTDVFTCKTEQCGWTVSLLFDDACKYQK